MRPRKPRASTQTVKPRSGGPSAVKSEAKKRGDAPGKQTRAVWESSELSRVDKIITFLESLPITSGLLTGERLRLLEDQRAFIAAMYGPRATPVLLAVKSEPRGNGKTGLAAGLCLCHLVGPEAQARGAVFSAASDRQQAALIFNEMVAMILAVPRFRDHIGIRRHEKQMEVLHGPGIGSTFESLPAESRTAHGRGPSFFVYDELAQAPDGELLEILRTGLGKKANAVGLVISTQAETDEHPMSRLIDEGLSGESPAILVDLLAAPKDADAFDPATIRAVNPALGIFLSESTVLLEAEQAKRHPAWQSRFRNLRLNQRSAANTESRLAQASEWKALEWPLDPEMLDGRVCYAGLDMAPKHDLTALVLVFPDDAAPPTYDVLAYFWTPAGAMSKRQGSELERFREWISRGYLTLVNAPIIEPGAGPIDDALLELGQRYDLQLIAYDPYLNQMPEHRFQIGVPWEKFGQGRTEQMSHAVTTLTACVQGGRLRHGGNPALTASVLGADVILKGGKPALDKAKLRTGVARIDGASALVMALWAATRAAGTEHVEGSVVFA
jgi:phage terminase large subunit-like protein